MASLVTFMANSQLMGFKAAIKTAKELWGHGYHPREVMLGVLLQHGSPDMLARCLTMYEDVESWWNVNVQAGRAGGSTSAQAARLGSATQATALRA